MTNRLKFPVFAVLTMAFLAGPVEALCAASCCPAPDDNAIVATPMGCCGEECGGSLLLPQEKREAVCSERAQSHRPTATAAVVAAPSVSPLGPVPVAAVDPTVSPPQLASPPLLALRI
jgi:hypothetical protein